MGFLSDYYLLLQSQIWHTSFHLDQPFSIDWQNIGWSVLIYFLCDLLSQITSVVHVSKLYFVFIFIGFIFSIFVDAVFSQVFPSISRVFPSISPSYISGYGSHFFGLYLASLLVRYFPKATVYGLTSTLMLAPDQAATGHWPTNMRNKFEKF